MARIAMIAAGIVFVSLATVFAKPLRPTPPPDFSKLRDESIKKWSGAEVLLVGKITQAFAGPVGLSQPPLHTFKLQIEPDKVLRGAVKKDKHLRASFAIRQQNPPAFPAANAASLIALKFVRGSWVVQHFAEATPDLIEQATLATSFPLGWTIREGKLTSPWAAVGKPATGKIGPSACSVTGRPVLLAGPGVRLGVEPVTPAKKFEFKNPDGDGVYTLTVKNETTQEVEVPALLTDGKTIRWDESVILRIQDKTYPIPGSTGNVSDLKPVVLKPGESVSGTLSVFTIDGPSWPRGGSRIEFQFCLGEVSATHSFYYFSAHHDPIRMAVQKALKKNG